MKRIYSTPNITEIILDWATVVLTITRDPQGIPGGTWPTPGTKSGQTVSQDNLSVKDDATNTLPQLTNVGNSGDTPF